MASSLHTHLTHAVTLLDTDITDADRAASDDMLRYEDIKELLGLELLGLIPECKTVLTATNMGQPVIMMENGQDASLAYQDAVGRLLGETVEMKFTQQKPKPGFFRKLFS